MKHRLRPRPARGSWILEGIIATWLLIASLSGGAYYVYQHQAEITRSDLANRMAAQHITFATALKTYVQAYPFAALTTNGAIQPSQITTALPGALPVGWDGKTPLGTQIIGVVAYQNGLPRTVVVGEKGSPTSSLRWRWSIDENLRYITSIQRQAARRIRAETGLTSLTEIYINNQRHFRDADLNALYPGIEGIFPSVSQYSLMTLIQGPLETGFWLGRVSVAARRFQDATESGFLNAGRYLTSAATLGTARLEFTGYAVSCPPGGIKPDEAVASPVRLEVLTSAPRTATSTPAATRTSSSGPDVAVLDATVCLPITPIAMRNPPAPVDLLPAIIRPGNTRATSSTTCAMANIWQQTAARTVTIGANSYTIAVAALETARTALTGGSAPDDATAARAAVSVFRGTAPTSAAITVAAPPGSGGNCLYTVPLSTPSQTVPLSQ